MKHTLFTLNRTPRAIVGIVGALLLLFLGSVSAGAQGQLGLAGKWDRLNPDQSNSTPEHEVLRCGGNVQWNCIYGKQPEPQLGFENPPDSTSGKFRGVNITSEWTCPSWFPPSICANATFVAQGVMSFRLSDGSNLTVDQALILTETGGDQVLYMYWGEQFVCPWYGRFSEALAANPFPTPFNGEDWPTMDCVFGP